MTRDELLKLPNQHRTIGEIISEAGFALVPLEPYDALTRAGVHQYVARSMDGYYKAMLRAIEKDEHGKG